MNRTCGSRHGGIAAIRSHVSACADSADTEIDGRFNRKMPLEPCGKPIGTLRTRLSLRSLICDIGRPAADAGRNYMRILQTRSDKAMDDLARMFNPYIRG
jgi:hypothetical protein